MVYERREIIVSATVEKRLADLLNEVVENEDCKSRSELIRDILVDWFNQRLPDGERPLKKSRGELT